MVSQEFIEEHQQEMRKRLQDIIQFNKKKKFEETKLFAEEQKRKIRQGQFRQKNLEKEIVDILEPIAQQNGLSMKELTSMGRSKACARARKEGIVALYNTFPGRPTEWYTRPFGYLRKRGAVYYLRQQGFLPQIPSRMKG